MCPVRNVTYASGRAQDIGYQHIDTARMYGNEAEVGRAVQDSGVDRSDIFITTKIWPDDLAYSDAKRCADDSLWNLGTDYVDLLLVHWPNKSIPLDETLRAFGEIKADGKARLIGVSNFNTALMKEAVERCGADIACNQVEYHPLLS
jgi:2,5-diketo-D-gluconate reductase B